MLEQDARLGGFKAELIQKQDMHLATLQKDLDRQQNYLDKMRSEVRHEIDKLTASQRLDLNLEKGCVCCVCQQQQHACLISLAQLLCLPYAAASPGTYHNTRLYIRDGIQHCKATALLTAAAAAATGCP